MTSGQVDGSLRIRGRNILDLRLDNGQTVREYLAGILGQQLGTDRRLRSPIHGLLVSHGMADDGDTQRVNTLIAETIEVLGAEPFRPIRVKTDTARRDAQLQRRHSPGKSKR